VLDAVVNALRDVTRAISQRAAAAGLEVIPTTEFRYSWWEGSPEVAGAHLQTESEPELSFKDLFDRIGQDAGQQEIAVLADRAGSHDQQHRWSPQFLMSQWKLIYQYFLSTEGVITLDENAVRTTVERYQSAVETAPYSLLTTVLWRGLSASEAFSVTDDIRFRPIAKSDYKIIGREPLLLGIREDRLIPYSTDWLCEIREQVPGQGHGTPHDMIDQVISAVALAASGQAEARLVGTEFENEFLKTGRISNPAWFATSRFGKPVQVSPYDVETLQRVYALLRRIHTTGALKYLRVPLRRFRSSTARPTEEDTLIDFVVALESLLAPDTQSIEVTFRFRLRGAAVLHPNTFGSSQQRLDFMNALYRARSRAVHGQEVQNLAELATRGEAALKAIFMWFATHANAESGAQAIVDEIDRKFVAAIHPG
jgi:hypothetical protein